MDYVIVGNGVASIGAIEGIRRVDRNGEILVISNEDTPTYGRPLISYYLSDKIGLANLPLRPDSFYEKNNVQMLLSTTVVDVDTAKKTVTTDTGREIPYGKLLLATGGAPIKPPLPGVEGEGVYNFVSKSDAARLMEKAESGSRAVIIGAGLIGLKAAEGLVQRGVSVTLVELFRLMGAYLDDTARGILGRHLGKQGLTIKEETAAKEIVRDEGGRITGLVTDKGFIAADIVVLAAGVRPNKALAEKAGIASGRGIILNDCLESETKDVYAAGDVAEARDLLTGKPVVIPIWSNAYQQGMYAGRNMAGDNAVYPGSLARNAVTFWGLPIMSAGIINPKPEDGCEVFVSSDEVLQNYRKLVFQGDVLVGYIFIGEVDKAGLYTGFIRNRVPLTQEAKEHLLTGTPSPLDWPEDLFRSEVPSARID